MRLMPFALTLFGVLVLVACGEDKEKKTVEEVQPAAVEDTAVSWDDEDKTLTVYAWPDYFAPGVISSFEAKTGIKVDYTSYQRSGELDRALKKDPSRYDVILASTSQVEGGRWLKKLQALDKKRLPNWVNLDKGQLKTVTGVDPGNKYAVPFLWGTLGVGFNYPVVRTTLGRKPPEKSWKLAFSPDYLELLGDCGVRLPNVADQVINAALLSLGKSPRTAKAADYDELTKLFTEIRPYIHLQNGDTTAGLLDGTTCVTIGWSPQLMAMAQESSRAGRNDLLIKYVLPRSGTMLWFDMLVTPKGAKHPGNAHKFMNYLMKADVTAEVTNYIGFANANAAATKLVDKMLSTDPLLYPPPETMKRTYVPITLKKKIRQMRAKAWNALSK